MAGEQTFDWQGELVESERRGRTGTPVPVRPARGTGSAQYPDRCLRGHDLAIAGTGRGYLRLFDLSEVTCEVCLAGSDPKSRWCLIDPDVQYTPDTAPIDGLRLVAVAPTITRGGIGRIELRFKNQVLGDVDFAVCRPCRRAVLEHIRVSPGCRRMGFGLVLLAAALSRARAEHYEWSTTKLGDSAEARGFWATARFPGTLGTPHYCTDMLLAAGLTP